MSYTTTGTSVSLGASKVLNGRAAAEGEFEFALTDAEGKVLQTVGNAADGSISFEAISYDEAGTYEYTISEVMPEDDDPNTEGVQKDGVTHDETVWTATVTVTDNLEGGFTATVAYNNGAELPVFTNTYVAPEVPAAPEPEPAPEIPDTGDHTSDALPAVLAVGGVAIAASAVAFAKRRNQ